MIYNSCGFFWSYDLTKINILYYTKLQSSSQILVFEGNIILRWKNKTNLLSCIDNHYQRKKSRRNNKNEKINGMTTENEENEAKEMMEEDQLNNQQDVSPKEKNGDETGTDKKDQKCVFYPNCTKQDTCPYFHPTELCKAFPSCTYGKNCRYIHPEVPCKYGIRCQRMGCSYAHPKKKSRSLSKWILLPPEKYMRIFSSCWSM